MSWALVLAGGGLTGLAWEAGVVNALVDSGIDLRSADLAIGTSAGSIVGSLLFGGVEPAEMKKHIADPDNSPLNISGQPNTDGDPMANLQVFARWSAVKYMDTTAAQAIAEAASRAKTMTEAAWTGLFEEIIGPLTWSPQLRIVSIDAASGERKFWSNDDGAQLVRIVPSSCAVPGIFPPVEANGSHYVDGGLWSNTSADYLLEHRVDKALLISPLGGDGDWAGLFADRATDREIEQLNAAGIETVLLRPEPQIAPLTAFDESKRVAWFETGLDDGRKAADRVRAFLA
ncbi:patatin-like phospholipase family protein [Antrihabitans cavernicola]|uniref:patatin-like phospholipase family protein n=1 Tax=Antrihabitans cavernicola TaxID=2495913 RepID=UPI001659D139|nr:patatin-like phospholipase family protein [Spelaeibacter cavernicola]